MDFSLKSKELINLDNKIEEIDSFYKKVISAYTFYYNGYVKLNKISVKLINKLSKIEVNTHFDEVIKFELLNKLSAYEWVSKYNLKGRYKFDYILKMYKINKKYIDSLLNYFNSNSLKSTIDKYEEIIPEWIMLDNEIGSERYIEEARYFSNRLLKEIYKKFFTISSKYNLFDSFDNYMKTIHYEKSSSSYHFAGKVYIGLMGLGLIDVYKDYVLKEYVNLVRLSRIICHETLFGHQGKYLLTVTNKIPNTIKLNNISVKVINELFGFYAEKMSYEFVKKINKDYLDNEIVEILKESSSLKFKLNSLMRVRNLFAFLWIDKKSINEELFKKLKEFTGDPFLNYNEVIVSKFKEKYFSDKMHGEDFVYNNVVYPLARLLLKEYEKEINKVPKKNREKFLIYSNIGHWSIDGFFRYIKYLKENLS